MLEVIGYLVWILATAGLTVLPMLLVGLSGLGGGLDKADKVVIALLWMLASYSWYNIFTSVTISIK